jgi:hypothetical protein
MNIQKKRSIVKGLWQDRKFINDLQNKLDNNVLTQTGHIIVNMINTRKAKIRLWQKELKTCL